MNLIISEKAIAGKRIATILSKNKFKEIKDNGISCFSFLKNEEEYLVIPLRGHINRVDFIVNSYWSIYNLDTLLKTKLVYMPVEKRIISLLQKKRKELKQIIIATDADREGEAIGLEAYNYLLEKNDKAKLSRAYFSALTDKEVNDAFDKLKELDFNYAYSVFARQEIDLLWGAILTRYLSVISNRKGKFFLSAGRVQTPLLNFIVKRELEILNFKPEDYIEITSKFFKRKIVFVGNHKDGKIFNIDKAKKIYEKIKNEKIGIVKKINKKEKVILRPPPFNTTDFLRAANSIGVGTSRAMSVAENLYQNGLISYPRTDNTVYPNSLNIKEILKTLCENKEYEAFINKILKKPIHASRGKKETTDHPPIHPVGYSNKLGGVEKKIYDLIVRRFLATLDENAKTENISVIIDIKDESFYVNGQRIIEAGWKKIYIFSKLTENILPELKEKEEVEIKEIVMESKETTPPNRYTEGGLIKLMDEQNIGTKSTRPEIIKKLKDRLYIEGQKNVSATKIAIAVCNVLEKHCKLITEPKLTAITEKEMDEIAAGKKEKEFVVNENRNILEKIIDILKTEKDKISDELRGAIKEDNVIGKCNLCGKNLVIRISKNNKQFVGCSGYPACKNTFPLPQRKITTTNEVCEFCKMPIVEVKMNKGTVKSCINMKCESKKEYFEKKEELKQKKENKKKESKK